LDWKTAYDKAIDRRNQEASYLFNRMNFLLTATAFLIAGLFALLGTGHIHHTYHNLPSFICILGIFLSISFCFMNQHNAIIIGKIDDYIICLEKHQNDNINRGPMQYISDIVKESRKQYYPDLNVAPHTQLLPLVFVAVWFVMLWIISHSVPWCIWGILVIFGIALVYLIFTFCQRCRIDHFITTTSLPDGKVGVGYSEILLTTGLISPLTWEITKGTPPGLSLDPDKGWLKGIPTASGTFSIIVEVRDRLCRTVSKDISITITPTQLVDRPPVLTGPKN